MRRRLGGSVQKSGSWRRATLLMVTLCLGSPCLAQDASGGLALSVPMRVAISDSVTTPGGKPNVDVTMTPVPIDERVRDSVVGPRLREIHPRIDEDVLHFRSAPLAADSEPPKRNRGVNALAGAAIGAFAGWVAGVAWDYELNKKTSHDKYAEQVRVYLGEFLLPPLGAIVGAIVGWHS